MATTLLLIGGAYAPPIGVEYTLSPHAALLVTSGGNGFILDMADSFFAVSPIGAEMIHLALTRGCGAAVAALATRYATEPATIRTDIERLLADLATRKILRPAGKMVDEAFGAATPRWDAVAIARLTNTVLHCLPSTRSRAAVLLMSARLSFALCGWVATVTAWQRYLVPRGVTAAVRLPAVAAIDATVRRVSANLPFLGDCKERALACWALARREGCAASIVVGANPYPLSAHAWCEAGTEVIGDDAQVCRRFVPVFRYI